MIPNKKLKTWEFFEGPLRLETPLHIASAGISLETDSPLLKTSGGQVYIPGTSIAGALRARAQERFDEQDLINCVFGCQKQDKTSLKSRLSVEDAYAGAPMTSVRDGVAIDRAHGSASEGAKYDLEITPKGLELPLTIKLEIREGDDEGRMRSLVFQLVEDLREGRIKLGAGKSRGLGKCRFAYTWRRLDFSKPDQIRRYLCNRNVGELDEVSDEDGVESKEAILNPGPFKEVACAIEMEIDKSPFLIKDGGWDDDYDAVFTKCRGKNGGLQDYIPGSSIKGVIRAHVERILRTLGGEGAACDILDRKDSCNAGVRNALKKFEKENKKKPQESERVKIIKETSCSICRLFGNAYLAGRIRFDDAFFDSPPPKKKYDHVAIDRFTGGAMEGKLFNEQVVTGGKTTLRFSIKNPTAFDTCLLAFLFRDLMEGFPPLRFGYGKAKGYGLLKYKGATINESEITGIDALKKSLDIEGCKHWWKEGKGNA